jgi:hypothetical protein
MPSTVLESCLCGKGSMDQRDCCQGQLRHQLTKSSRDQGHTNPTSRATLRISRKSCRRNRPKRERAMVRIVVIARCERVQNGQSQRGDDGLINTCSRAAQLPPVCKQTSEPTFKFDASQTGNRGLVSEQKLPYVQPTDKLDHFQHDA